MKIPKKVIATCNDILRTYNTLHWNVLRWIHRQQSHVKMKDLKFPQKTLELSTKLVGGKAKFKK